MSKDVRLIWEAYLAEEIHGVDGNQYGETEMDQDPHAKKVMKKPIPLQYRIAEEPQTLETKEGPIQIEAGFAIMTGTEGEEWAMPPEDFEEKYNVIDDGIAASKGEEKLAKQMNRPFHVTVEWSTDKLQGKLYDWLVKYGPGDYGVVDQKIFNDTYDVNDPDAPSFDEYGRRTDGGPSRDPRFD